MNEHVLTDAECAAEDAEIDARNEADELAEIERAKADFERAEHDELCDKLEAQSTPEIAHFTIYLDDKRGHVNSGEQRQEALRRITAAINATTGIPTAALEKGVVAELIAMLREGHDYIIETGEGYCGTARAMWHTLEKTTGGAQ